MSGRELFTFNPDLVKEDGSEADEDVAVYGNEENEDELNGNEFMIDERTFFNIGEDGKMIDEDIEELDENFGNEDENSDNIPGSSKPILFDENLFDVDIPEDESDEESVEGGDIDQTGSNVEKLKIGNWSISPCSNMVKFIVWTICSLLWF